MLQNLHINSRMRNATLCYFSDKREKDRTWFQYSKHLLHGLPLIHHISQPITHGNSIKVAIRKGQICSITLNPPVINQWNVKQVTQNVKIPGCENPFTLVMGVYIPMLTRCSCSRPLKANVAVMKPSIAAPWRNQDHSPANLDKKFFHISMDK